MDVSFLSYGASRCEYQAMAALGHVGFHAMEIRVRTPLVGKQVLDPTNELNSSEEDVINACESAPVRAPERVALCEADRLVYEVKRRGKNAILQRNVQPGWCCAGRTPDRPPGNAQAANCRRRVVPRERGAFSLHLIVQEPDCEGILLCPHG